MSAPTPVQLPYGLTVDQVARLTAQEGRALGDEVAARGACRGADPEIFFPAGSAVEHAAEAIRVCRALASHTDHGVWGAYTARQRRPWLRAVSARRREIKAAAAEQAAERAAGTAARS